MFGIWGIQRQYAPTWKQIEDSKIAKFTGTIDTKNGGITWPGTQMVGPGNRVSDDNGKPIMNSVAMSPMDLLATKHDVQYNNMVNPSKRRVWEEADWPMIKESLTTPDPYYANYAAVGGLLLKNLIEFTDEAVFSTREAIYPNGGDDRGHIPWYDSPNSVPVYRYDSADGVEEDPDLQWDYGDTPSESDVSVSADDNNTVDNGGLGGPGSGTSDGSFSQQSIESNSDTLPTDQVMSDVSSSKRPAESSGGGGSVAKKGKKSLPGTAQSDGDPDTGNASTENAVIPRPIGSTGGGRMVFRKVHTFLSYGLSWCVIKDSTANSNLCYGVTSLMSLNVDKPFMYMSPSEFRMLPRNSVCTHLSGRVVMRNPRTAFKTGASTSTLATLNQNKFAVVGEGLNLSTRGITKSVQCKSNEPMVPQACLSTYNQEIKTYQAMYGQDINGDTSEFMKSDHNLPASYCNLPLFNNFYYTMIAQPGWHSGIANGWDRINEKITKIDASSMIGKTIGEWSYKPICGQMTIPHEFVNIGVFNREYPSQQNFEIINASSSGMMCSFDKYTSNNNVERTPMNTEAYTSETWSKIVNQTCYNTKSQKDELRNRYQCPIDLGQYMGYQQEIKPKSLCVQPSYHVGIMPVPRLTTTTGDVLEPKSFTDVENMWEVYTEMVVEYDLPHTRTAFSTWHEDFTNRRAFPKLDNNKTKNTAFNADDLSILDGHYVTPAESAVLSATTVGSTIVPVTAEPTVFGQSAPQTSPKTPPPPVQLTTTQPPLHITSHTPTPHPTPTELTPTLSYHHTTTLTL